MKQMHMKQAWLALILSSALALPAMAELRGGQDGPKAERPAQYGSPMRLAAGSGTPADHALLREIQEKLTTLGYDPGPADGLMGWQTHEAIRSFQQNTNVRVDGEPSDFLLDQLRTAVALRGDNKRGDRHHSRKSEEPPTNDLARLVRDLTQAIREAERRRRAEPAFLAELGALLQPYRQPEHRRVLGEDFSDGNFTVNPAWTVASGDFTVSGRGGLVSRVANARQGGRRNDRPEDVAAAVLSQILTGQSQHRPREARPESAEIFTRASFSNDFALDASVQVRADSVCDIGVFDAAGQGYFLSLSGGKAPILTRQSGGRTEIIGGTAVALPVLPVAVYDIKWTRNPGGDMYVRLADGADFKVQDLALRDNFEGVVHSNRFGQCALRSISVVGAF